MTHLIGGAWVKGTGDEFTAIDPSNGTVIWRSNEATADQVDVAVAAARKAFETWGFMPFDDRVAIVKAYAEKLTERKAELAELIAKDAGKTRAEAQSDE